MEDLIDSLQSENRKLRNFISLLSFRIDELSKTERPECVLAYIKGYLYDYRTETNPNVEYYKRGIVSSIFDEQNQLQE